MAQIDPKSATPESAPAEANPIQALGDQALNVDDWIPENLAPYWDLLNQYPLLGALGIALLFYFVAFLVRAVILGSLERLATKTTSTIDNTIIRILRRPIFTATFSLGLIIAVQVAQLPFGTGALTNILASFIVVNLMLAALGLSSALLDGLSNNPKFNLIETRTIPLFDLVSKLVIVLVASYILLLVWGVNPVGWLASAGIMGIAVGFAAKDTLANLFSGLFIVADAPYKLGDYINLDSGERGQVTQIGMRSTRLLTRSDVEITIPNAVIANAKITNESGGPYEKMRIRIPVGAAYGSDVDQVCQVLKDTGVAHGATCDDPSPRVRMRAFGASSLDFELLCWIEKPEDRGRISHELYMSIYKAFADANIEIPYAKRDLYIKEFPTSP